MPLSDATIRSAKPKQAPWRLADGRGLYLVVTPAGQKYWRYRWESQGKQRSVTLGEYPVMGLAAARSACDSARAARWTGREPKAPPNPAATFAQIARRWHAQNVDRWAPTHAAGVIGSMVRDLFPEIGDCQIRDIDAPKMLAALRKIEARGSIETARRVGQRAGMVFTFAIGEGLATENPALTVRAALKHPVRGRQPAVIDLAALRKMLAAADVQTSHPVTKLASRLLALTAVRPGCIIGATWREFEGLDGAEPQWRIPAERMKGRVGNRTEHVVPLAPAAVEVIETARSEWGGGGGSPLLFPSVRSAHKPMSANAIGYLLHRAGFHGEHVPHGFRAAFSTIMNERHPSDRAVIDLMLAHVAKDKVEAAYNRATHTARRRQLALEWADLILEGARPAADLLEGARR